MPEEWVGRDTDLATIALFAGLPRRLLRQAAAVIEWRRFAPGERLLTAGTAVREFFLVVEGSVAVRLSAWEVARVGPGGLVGASVLNGVHEAAHNADAEGGVLALALGFEEIQAIVTEHAEIGERISAIVGERAAALGI